MPKILTLLILTAVLAMAKSITFSLVSRDPICFKISGNDTYKIDYVSSGIDDKKVRMELFQNSLSLYKVEDVNDMNLTMTFNPGIV